MRVVLYARVSSEKQDTDLSLTAQLKALRAFAATRGYEVVREYVDEAESGRSSSRPAFKEMIAAARRQNKPFEGVLIWKYSRFARSREDSIVFKTLLRKNGVQVISMNEPSEDTPVGHLMEGIIESLDEFYSENLGEEVTRGMRESASRGFYQSFRPPYGYNKIKVADGTKMRTKLELNTAQAKIVETIFKSVLSGMGTIEIVRDLNSRAIPSSKGKTWTKGTIYSMLTNEIYTGNLIWGKKCKRNLEPIKVEGACPTIIDEESFKTVQQMLEQRAPTRIHPRVVSSKFLLSGLARCGYCGKALTGTDAKSGKFSYYVCGSLSKKGAGSCQFKYLNAKKFESAVVNEIKKSILTNDNLIELAKIASEEWNDTLSGLREDIDTIDNSLKDMGCRLVNLYDAIETGKFDLPDLALRIKELRMRQDQLLERKRNIELQYAEHRYEILDPKEMALYVEDLQSLLDESEICERKAFIKGFVQEIKVKGDEVTIEYTPPLPQDKRETVLSIGGNGGR
ncbi:recombinase family protein [Dehalogenimonas etheniformans]|uniref:Recombinase family protein n=1 Tax=Dehalogenimonas etheniformans TaxID=1536648 RepID=A0A2P5P8M8_9CHLR|nr:recombinase family protein [Dehalogenimonas etheniformans]PPD58662.1 recombinase family protein [Dehalogenimonas etheniformans]QNT76566.1 recombinase family protein [Dehalogenimonas etheniformans]